MARWEDGSGLGTWYAHSSDVTYNLIFIAQVPGSIFNHSSTPNVSYIVDAEHACIRYTTMRPIAPAEELCIFYGNKLWFDDRSGTPVSSGENSEDEDGLALLSSLELDQAIENPDELIPEDELPFERVAAGEDESEPDGVGETRMLVIFSFDNF